MCGVFGSNSGADVDTALRLMPRGKDERHTVKSGNVVFGVLFAMFAVRRFMLMSKYS